MQTFVVFGVGLGNLGASARKRIGAERWIVQLNRSLRVMSAPVTVVAFYGHTGNFIVQSMAKRKAVCQVMGQVLGTSCAALTISGLQVLAETLEELEIPAPLPGVRYTPGAVMQVLRSPIQSAPGLTTRATYQKFTDSIVIALKHDATTGQGCWIPTNLMAAGAPSPWRLGKDLVVDGRLAVIEQSRVHFAVLWHLNSVKRRVGPRQLLHGLRRAFDCSNKRWRL